MTILLKKLQSAVQAAPPTIISFTGDASTLSWVTENATSASINNGIGAVALSGSMANPFSPSGTYNSFSYTYTLTASSDGLVVTANISIFYPHTFPWYCPHVPHHGNCAGFSG